MPRPHCWGKIKGISWITIDGEREWVLSWFGKTTDSAIQAYREFVAEGVGQERRPELVGGRQVRSGGGWSVVRGRSRQMVGDERILGGEVFVATVLREAEVANTPTTGGAKKPVWGVRGNRAGLSAGWCQRSGTAGGQSAKVGVEDSSLAGTTASGRVRAVPGRSCSPIRGLPLRNCQEFTESPDRIIPVIQQRPLLTSLHGSADPGSNRRRCSDWCAVRKGDENLEGVKRVIGQTTKAKWLANHGKLHDDRAPHDFAR